MRAQEIVVDLLARSPRTHALLVAPGFEEARTRLGRRRAYRTFARTARLVPAYREFLAERGAPRVLPRGSRDAAFAALPVMDKDSYIRRWSITDRCVGGRLPRRGVVVDESSGSSGVPTSWVRGPVERRASRELLRVGFLRTASTLRKPPFVINAFSLDAWATGMNVSASLTGRVGRAAARVPVQPVRLPDRADPQRTRPGETNTEHGGRGVYFLDPAGHYLEMITQPYL